jgi:hypothetical protein
VSSCTVTCPSAPDFTSLPRWAPALPCVPWLRALPPRLGSSGAATCPTPPSGLWTTGIKRSFTALKMQLGSHVSKVRSHVTEVPARHANRQCHHNLQDMQTCRYSVAQQCSPRCCPFTCIVGRGCDPTGATERGTLHTTEDIICYS